MDALKYITPKFFTTIRNYSKGQFIKDLIAGVIVAIIALPLPLPLVSIPNKVFTQQLLQAFLFPF